MVSLSRESMLQLVEGSVVLTLRVPEEALLITDAERWGYRVNQWYIPLDQEDERRHNSELETIWYRQRKSAIIDSDKGNFLSPSSQEDCGQLGAVVHLSSPLRGYGPGRFVGAAPGVDRNL